jgi:hypothetical protein
VRTLIVLLALSSAAAAQVTVAGTVTYQDRTYDGGGFTGTTTRFVRQAEIELVRSSDNALLGSGTTDDNGAFSFNIAADMIVRLRVYARRVGGKFNAEIRNNLGSNQLYTALSNTYDTTSGVPFTITLTIAGAAPVFNLFDCAVNSFKYLALREPSLANVPPLLRIFWQAGSTNGTYYDRSVNSIFLLGQTSDPDEYDDDIVLHEIGHWITANFSKDDTPGGPHTIVEQLDPRLSWSEGFAHYWSAAVRQFAGYPFPTLQVDNFGSGHSTFDIEGPSVPSQAIMATNELAVVAILWDIIDTVDEGGFDGVGNLETPVWKAIKEQIPNRINITLEDFHVGLAAVLNDPPTMDLVTGTEGSAGIFKDRKVRYYADGSEQNNAFGFAKTLTPGPAGLVTRTFHDSTDEDWYSIVATPGTLTVETRNLGDGGDTRLELYDSTGTTLLASNDNRGPSDLSSQVSHVAPLGGTFLARVVRVGSLVERGYYDIRAQIAGNGPPTVTAISASAVQGSAPLRVTFTASISDVDGGSHEFRWDFNGDGIVDWSSFASPTVTTTFEEAGTFASQLQVVDSGDSSVTATVTISVLPFTPPTVTLSAVSNGTAPHTVNFDATVSGATPTAFLWDADGDGIDDGASTATAAFPFTYRSAGTFFPRLLIRDSQGRATRALVPAITVAAGASPPTIGAFTATGGIVPYASSMDVGHSDLGPSGVVEFDVDGDGRFDFRVPAGSATGTTFLPEIQRAGTFSPVVRVTDSAGLSLSATAAYVARTVGLAGWMVDPRAGDRLSGNSVTLTAQAVPQGPTKMVQFQVRTSAGPGPWTNVGAPIASTGTLFTTTWDVTGLPNLTSFDVRILINGTASSGDAANTVVIDSGAPTISENGALRAKSVRNDRTTISRAASGVWAIVPLGSTPDPLALTLDPAAAPAANGTAAGKTLHGSGYSVTFAGTITSPWILRLPCSGDSTSLEIHHFDTPSGTWHQFAPSRAGDDGWVETEVNATGVYAVFGPVPAGKKRHGGCGATGLEALALLILLRRRR